MLAIGSSPRWGRSATWASVARVALLGVALTLSAVARADAPPLDTREQARNLGYAGVRDYAQGNFDAASVQLERSYALLPVPSLGLWSARSLVKLGKLVEAEARYRAVVNMTVEPDAPAVQHAARATAELELGELLPRLPTLRVHVRGAPTRAVRITLDDVPVAPPLDANGAAPLVGALDGAQAEMSPPIELHANPGPHRIVGLRGQTRVALDVVAREGSAEDLELRFPDPSQAPSRAQAGSAPAAERQPASAPSNAWRTAAWTALGVSAASLVTSSVTYYFGHREYAALQKEGVCQGEVCQASGDLGTYNALRTTHLVTLLAGAVFGAAGLGVLWLDPGAEPTATAASQIPLTLTVDAHAALLTGHF
jgi:hypothetical protein